MGSGLGSVRGQGRATRALAAVAAALLLPLGSANGDDCLPQITKYHKKAAPAIVRYPTPQEPWFDLEVHVGLVNNHRDEIQGPTSPITIPERPHYCNSINAWAKYLFVSTEGLYRIRRADFWDVDANSVQLATTEFPFQVKWNLGWAMHEAFWPAVLVHAQSPIVMSDTPFTCSAERFVDGNDEYTYPPSFRCDAGLHGVPGVHACDDFNVEGLFPWAFCTEGGELVEPNSSFHGGVLHHEGGHFLFGFPDEADRDNGRTACFSELEQVETPACGDLDAYSSHWIYDGEPVNPIGGTTSAMAVGAYRYNFCDDTTHLHAVMTDSGDLGGGAKVSLNQATLNDDLNASMWEILRDVVPGFDNGDVHEDGVFDSLSFGDLPDIECHFHQSVFLHDPVMVIDRSGSMDLPDPQDPGYTALDAAKEAAAGLYNTVPLGQYTGVVAYNASPSIAQAYQPRAGSITPEADLTFGATGSTDIEEAIRRAKDELLLAQGQEEDVFGSMILLSDGLPTSPAGRTEQEHWDFTLAAAKEACDEGKPPIQIFTMSFGDADVELLHAIASACNTLILDNGANRSPGETPLDFKETLTRLGHRARATRELLHERQPLQASPASHTFIVPEATAELRFTWLGKPLSSVDVGGTPISCAFDQLQFELESPSSVPIDAATVSPVGPVELGYGTRTAFLPLPEPGTWTARVLGTPDCLDVQPELVWLADARNSEYSALVELSPDIAPRNVPVRVEGTMFHHDLSLVDISVTFDVRNDGASSLLLPNDDGLDGDRVAGDGIYTATMPGLAPGEDAGAVTVVATFDSQSGLSGPVPIDSDPGLGGPRADPFAPRPFPGTARLLVEQTMVRTDCCDPGGDTTGCLSICDLGLNATVPAPQIQRSGLQRDVNVEVCGLPLVPGAVQAGFGSGVSVSNLRSTYDPTTRCGTLTVDATVSEDAALGPRSGAVESGGRRMLGDQGFVVCTADLLPDVPTEDVWLTTCSSASLDVVLPVPAATEACGGGGVTLTGWLQTVGGVPSLPPVPVDPANPVVSLAPGVNEIAWQATEPASGSSKTVVQSVLISELSCLPSGNVPDGSSVPGTPLTLGKSILGGIELSWGGSCSATDVDYEIYEGTLGDFTSHLPRFCSTGGAMQKELLPTAGNAYYLVVPVNATGQEGSYGTTSGGSERPDSAAACLPQLTGGCAPM